MGKKKPKGARDPNSTVPFITSGLIILAAGLGGSYFLYSLVLPGEPNDKAGMVLGLSIIVSGVLFIAAWAKRK